jgi:hypothetical protein
MLRPAVVPAVTAVAVAVETKVENDMIYLAWHCALQHHG